MIDIINTQEYKDALAAKIAAENTAKEAGEKLKELDKKVLENRREVARQRNQFLIDSGIANLIEHGRTSCSDDNICNGYSPSRGYSRCDKCLLLELINGAQSLRDFEVSVALQINKIPDE